MIDKTEEVHEEMYGNVKAHINFTTNMEDVSSPTTQPDLMDTSFEQNLSEEHGKAIWKASIQFLRNSLKINFDQSKGFNDENIFSSQFELKETITEKTDPKQLLTKNMILSTNQKKSLLTLLQKSKHLKKLIFTLYTTYIDEVFDQFVVLIYEILCKYLIDKESTKLSEELSRLMSPGFTDFSELDSSNRDSSEHYLEQNQNQIVGKAEEVGIEVSNGFIVSTKIRILNLKDIQGVVNNSNAVRSEFQSFMEVLAKAVYLCAEGCFQSNQSPFAEIASQPSCFEKTSESEDDHYLGNIGRKRRRNS